MQLLHAGWMHSAERVQKNVAKSGIYEETYGKLSRNIQNFHLISMVSSDKTNQKWFLLSFLANNSR